MTRDGPVRILFVDGSVDRLEALRLDFEGGGILEARERRELDSA